MKTLYSGSGDFGFIPSKKEQLDDSQVGTIQNNDMVAISKQEYDQLLYDSLKLSALEMAGVDNWDGEYWEIFEEMLLENNLGHMIDD